MILMPEANTAVIDPFFEETTVNIRCDVIEPTTMQGYERDPRSLAKRAEAYLKSTGIADYALFGPENEFFIFDSVRSGSDVRGCFYEIDSVQGAWNSSKDYPEGNKGHRPGYKGGYFPVPPVDAFQDIRSAMCLACEEMGLKVEVHHHEVATGGQAEIGIGAGTLVQKADGVQILKYCVHNVANGYGKSATFMPKPLVGDNGNGMHVHQSLQKEGRALFAGDKYGGLSDLALYYIGGVIKHAKALNAITNPGTNSYKRLVPGFEAPTLLAYSARNRSASIRIPWVSNPKARRIEVRFPDSAANPYFAFAAIRATRRTRICTTSSRKRPSTSRPCAIRSTWRSSISTGTASFSPAAACSPTTSSTPTWVSRCRSSPASAWRRTRWRSRCTTAFDAVDGDL